MFLQESSGRTTNMLVVDFDNDNNDEIILIVKWYTHSFSENLGNVVKKLCKGLSKTRHNF